MRLKAIREKIKKKAPKMYELRRISLMNWNLIELEDLDIFGTTALIGAVGVGKSTILDAIQTVLNGNQKSKLKLNRAAGVKSSKRSVLEYCLGYTEETQASGEVRPYCDTILVLTFHDAELKHSVAVGLVLFAEQGAQREETRARFIAPGVDFSFAEFGDAGPDGSLWVNSWQTVLDRIKKRAGENYVQTGASRAEYYIDTYLKTMRAGARSPNVKAFQKRFRNAIAFEEIANPTDFVRSFILEDEPIDTELLRSNLETWEEISRTITKLEEKIRAAKTVRRRYQEYAVHKLDYHQVDFAVEWHQFQALSLDLKEEHARLERKKSEVESAEAEVVVLKVRLENERMEADRIKNSIREAGTSHKGAVAEARLAMQSQNYQSVFDELKRSLKLISRVSETRSLSRYLPEFVNDAQAAGETLDKIANELDANDAMPDGEKLKELAGRILKGKEAKHALVANADALSEELATQKSKAQKIESQLRTLHAGAPVLDGHVTRFIEKLLAEGISARSLPELVEIREGKEDWVGAAEAALGAFREAIIVSPADIPRALSVLKSARMHGKQDLWRVRLVNTARIAEERGVRPADENAIVSILETNDDLVRKFLDSQFGNIVMVDTEEELRNHFSAIMIDGAQSQGLSLRVNERRNPVLGRRAQQELRESMKYDLATLNEEIKSGDLAVRHLRMGEKIFDDLDQITLGDLAALLESLTEARRLMDELRRERDQEAPPEVRALIERAESINRTVKGLENRRNELQTKKVNQLNEEQFKLKHQIGECRKKRTHSEGRLREMRELDAGNPFVSYRKSLLEMDDPASGKTVAALEKVLDRSLKASKSDHLDRLKEMQTERDRLEGEARNVEQRTKLIATFLNNHNEDISITERSKADIFSWIVGLTSELEDNDLRQHKDSVEEVRLRTRDEVREMLVVRLSDKFKRAREELKMLNRRLRGHRFEGLTYLFTWSLDPEMRGLYEMTRRVSEDPEKAQSFLTAGGDPLLDEAVDQIREIFSSGVDTSRFEDYRQYFNYELRMTHDEVDDAKIDRQEEGTLNGVTFTGNLTDRAGKGSGGQKQTPYYVAIAASMASAYYPGIRHESARGMGLVCFDEAFSKLDINNTQNLVKFFRDLGLQVLVAAPEEKRTSFMEIMDTVINISKMPGGTDLFFRTTEIGDRAKEALREANPERKGITGFRKELEVQPDKTTLLI